MAHDKLTQDNEPLTFQALGLAAALVVNRMRNAQALRELQTDSPDKGKEDGKPETDRSTETKKEEERRFVERRLKELAAFEERFKRVKI